MFIVDPNFVAGPHGDYYDFCSDGINPNENFSFVCADVVSETAQLDNGSDEGLDHLRTNTDRDETNDEEINSDETDQLNYGDNQVANPNKPAHELQVKLDLANAEIERLQKEVETYQQHSKNANESEIQLQRNKDLCIENHEVKTQNTDLVSRIAQLEKENRLRITDAYLSNADNDDRFTKAQEQLREANEKIAKSGDELRNLHEQLNILKSELKSTKGSFQIINKSVYFFPQT